MTKYLGSTGLSRLWNRYKTIYLLKTDELSGANPDTTYTYTESTDSPTAIAVTVITSHSGSTDTLICTLSQAVEVNLLFKVTLASSTYKRYFTVIVGNTSVSLSETGVSGNNSGSLQKATAVELVDASTLSSKYTFTITTHFNQGSTYEHTITMTNAQVDWHTNTISGTLQRTTSASTKPTIYTYIGVCRITEGGTLYYRSSQVVISSGSNSTTLSNVALTQTYDTYSSLHGSECAPVGYYINGSYPAHHISTVSSTYTPLDLNINISISSWSQTNLRPTLVWYRSSGDCVYGGTLPTANCTVSGLASGDSIKLIMYAYFGTDASEPYTVFQKTVSWGGGSTIQFAFQDTVNHFVGIVSSGSVSTTYIRIQAYVTNTSMGINNKYIGYWPSTNTTSSTGAFVKTNVYNYNTSLPRSTNTTLFGTVTLDGKLW